MKTRLTAVAALLTIGLAACSGGDANYDSGRDLHEALEELDFDCEIAGIFNRTPGQVVECESGDRLAVADDAADMFDDPADISDNLHTVYLIADTWMIATTDLESIEAAQEELGGSITEHSPLALLAEECQRGHVIDYDDEYDVLSISNVYQPAFHVRTEAFECVADQLPVPSHVQDDISRTRAIDGTRESSWDVFEASWTYHPDSGLNIQIEGQAD